LAQTTQLIPVNEPLLNGNEEKYVLECVRTGWVSSAGKFLEEFESGWAAYCGRKHGVAVSNGTVAIDAAIDALHLEPGDEVILPTFTIISCILQIVRSGAKPVLVDSDPRTWTMDTSNLESRITPRTKAVMPVHIYGHPVDMDPVLEAAQKHNLAIIEDAAEVHGSEYFSRRDNQWHRCGSFGTASTFSFYANKLLTTGEGGMILTDDDAFADELRAIRNLRFLPERRFLHEGLGTNMRMTNLQAALGVAQLERMDEIVMRKRRMGQRYTEGLQGIEGLQIATEEPWAKHVYWMYGLVLDESRGMDAVEFAKRLRAKGVETRPFFLGMHEQPVLQRMGLFQGERYPVADRIARQGLYLPSGLALTNDQIDRVIEAVREVLA